MCHTDSEKGDKMNFFKKTIFIIMCLSVSIQLFAAALKIYTAMPTQVTIFFDNTHSSEQTVVISQKRPFKINRFLGGFKKIRWTNPDDGRLYEVQLNIPGSQGWYVLRIVRNMLTIEQGIEREVMYGTLIL